METDLIFVYGSLLSSGINHHLLRKEGAVSLLGEAYTHGDLYLIDWYPGFVSGGSHNVRGEMYQMNNPSKTLKALDTYECAFPEDPRSEYKRIILPCSLENKSLKCWVYEYIKAIGQSPIIPDGDFIQFIKSST